MKSMYNLLKEYVLIEGRKEDVIKKYPNVPVEIIDAFVEGEGLDAESISVWKSKDNKYLDWMVNEYNKRGLQPSYIIELVKNFYERESMMTSENLKEFFDSNGYDFSESVKNAIKNAPRDIRNYPDLDSLRVVVTFLIEKKSKSQKEKEVKQQGIRIAKGEYKGAKFIVISPTTHAASCQYGKHSQWCVATENTSHFANYTKKGTLYFFIQTTEDLPPITPRWADKTRNQVAGEPPFKTALLIEDDGDRSWWTKADTKYEGWVGDYGFEWFTQDIADAILNYNRISITKRLEREINLIKNTKGFTQKENKDTSLIQGFTELLKNNVLTEDQLITIIKNDNWPILYQNDYKEVYNVISDENFYKLLIDLMRSLPTGSKESSETLKDMDSRRFFYTIVDKKLSETENKKVAEIIINKVGSKVNLKDFGSDVRMFVDKWTMTPEKMEEYMKTSDYFFIGTKIGAEMRIEDITKIDRFDPNTHDSLTLMLYTINKKTQRTTSTGLYAVRTDKDLLDPYIGDGGDEIPEEIIKTLIPKSTLIWPKK
jgi:hypothetical protein